MTRSVCIVGLGLIGGSLGMALRQTGWHVDFIDPAVTEADAVARNAANRRLASISDSGSAAIVLATPADAAIEFLRSSEPSDRVVTSVCSVLAPLANAGRVWPHFIAGHPMAGSQEHGLAAARADLFVAKRWFVDASRSEDVVEAMIAASGARLDRVDPQHHDSLVAMTSHLPQLLSTALAAMLANAGAGEIARFGGSGLATFLRLAGSDAAVWEPILAANRSNVDAAVRSLVEEIDAALRDPARSFAAANELLAAISAGRRDS